MTVYYNIFVALANNKINVSSNAVFSLSFQLQYKGENVLFSAHGLGGARTL